MSAPPLFRLVDERRVSVVRDAAACLQVFDDDPVGSCMVAARVAEFGVEPGAIGRLEKCNATACELKFDETEGWLARGRLWGIYANEKFN